MSPIRVETGPMFSGKTSAIREDIKYRLIGKQTEGKDFLAFNHQSDVRYGGGVIASHDGLRVQAIPIESSQDLLNFLFDLPEDLNDLRPSHIKKEYIHLREMVIDECQFFDMGLPAALEAIDKMFREHPDREKPLEIVAAGLDQDFRGEPFGPMALLMTVAHQVNKHVGVCTVCGEKNGTRTQRITDGRPANYNDPVVLVGAEELYTIRCDEHHEVPGKKLFENNR
jgi:thymidine kinase